MSDVCLVEEEEDEESCYSATFIVKSNYNQKKKSCSVGQRRGGTLHYQSAYDLYIFFSPLFFSLTAWLHNDLTDLGLLM